MSKIKNKQQTISGEVTLENIFGTINVRRLFKQIAFNVKILNMVNNPQVTNVHGIQVGTSETIRLLSNNDNKWFDWLAGLIDGDGCFLLSKKGYASLEITMDMKDSRCLYNVKQKLGGSVKRRSGVKAIRYRLHDYKNLLFLLLNLNGRIRNPTRQIQFSRLCNYYKINFKFPDPLTYENGWLAGFFDSDGTITINKSNLQLSISIFQKSSELLNNLKILYGGYVYIDRSLNGGFKWYLTSRIEIESLINNYFKNYPSRATSKCNRLHLVPDFYFIKTLDVDPIVKNNMWIIFFKKWLHYYEDLTD